MVHVLPKVVIHNSVSIDNSLTGFEPNMQLHYKIASSYTPQAHLIGSNTAKTGVELFNQEIPKEEKTDFEKPIRNNNLPYWVLIDSKGILQGILHVLRRFEYLRDIIVMIGEKASKDYIDYLKERNYDFHVAGKNHVNLKEAIELLSEKYGVSTVLTDTGQILNNLLLNEGLVSEISLLMHPVIVGKKAYPLFSNVSKNLNVSLYKKKAFNKGYIWLVYKINSSAC